MTIVDPMTVRTPRRCRRHDGADPMTVQTPTVQAP